MPPWTRPITCGNLAAFGKIGVIFRHADLIRMLAERPQRGTDRAGLAPLEEASPELEFGGVAIAGNQATPARTYNDRRQNVDSCWMKPVDYQLGAQRFSPLKKAVRSYPGWTS